MVFDEATSNLDHKTSKLILDILQNDLKDATRLVIAHKLTSIVKCSKVVVMHKGKVLQAGTVNELMQQEVKYGLKELVDNSEEKEQLNQLIK